MQTAGVKKWKGKENNNSMRDEKYEEIHNSAAWHNSSVMSCGIISSVLESFLRVQFKKLKYVIKFMHIIK